MLSRMRMLAPGNVLETPGFNLNCKDVSIIVIFPYDCFSHLCMLNPENITVECANNDPPN